MARNIFNSIQMARSSRNMFDLSHDVKLSLAMGELVPIMCTECIPGDKFNISCESLLRFAPLISPVMHRMDVTMHYFFVPNRLLWQNWEKYITNSREDGLLPAFPTVDINEANYNRLADYLGIPSPLDANTETVSAMPFAAYNKIYNDYYRDQNLIDPLPIGGLTGAGDYLVDGQNDAGLYVLRNRAWEHDYFTSALPFAQKGEAVDIPLGDVQLKDDWSPNGQVPYWQNAVDNPIGAGNIVAAFDPVTGEPETGTAAARGAYNPNGSLEVTSTTINDLRRAFKLQEWLEKNARGGTRYVENILMHFGLRSQDSRLQRPEYITGTKSPVVISEVLNTTGTDTLPQGNMAGHAVSVTGGQSSWYKCQEHGYIIGIMSVMPKTAYQQGIPKHFLKTTDPTQFYWPSFANLGEQEIQNKEVYAFQGPSGTETFGYTPRYAEYRFEMNRVAGEFRNSLSFWHAGRIFAAPPALNADFVTSDPTTRIFAVEGATDTQLYCHVFNKIKAVRAMPKFGTPSF